MTNVRMDKGDCDALEKTIARTGLAQPLSDRTCIAFSKPDTQGNKAVHAKANEQLLETLLRNEPGHCIHITGEMRALADPFHRRLCAELVKRSKERFTIIYNVPSDQVNSPEGIRLWAEKWRSKAWTEKLSAINFIGDAFVDVRAYNTLDEIQYSVFGNRYILLQEKHSDEGNSKSALPKRVWLLESRTLNEFLTARAINIADKSKDIPETLFKRFLSNVNGVTAQNILARLARSNGSVSRDEVIDEALQEFDPEAADDLKALEAIGFVKSDKPTMLTLTGDGFQYLEALKRY
jgi:hypothetical protein